MLARFDGVFRQHVMRRHAHRHQRRFDRRIGVHGFVVAVGAFDSVFLAGSPGCLFVRRANGVNLGFRQALQRRNMRERAPTTGGTDKTYP